MNMKLNERSMAHYATSDSPADLTGYLYKRGARHTAYQKRWFVLKGNLLFYFEEQDSREPVGVVVLEGCTVELCQSKEEYAFTIRFNGSGSRSYILAAETQEEMESWVKTLSRASYEYMRLVVRELERQLELAQKSSIRRKSSRHRGRSRAVSRNKWENPRSADLCNGYLHSGDSNMEVHTKDSTGAMLHPLPPPLPPRRRGAVWIEGSVQASSAMTLESPVCPGTYCFSKLHEWYGKEIEELRKTWQRESKSQTDCTTCS
ncbi:sesquipedalian-2 [Rhinophrynus dorsalis]